MSLDWSARKAVVLQSDDWGLCAWSPDDAACHALAQTPAFRGRAGRRYRGSTLESAADVRALSETLLEFRGGDGGAPVWQANTIMASPDYARLDVQGPPGDPLPLVEWPEVPSRWQRPGLRPQVDASIGAGVWWPELHGLHHLPERAWRDALRRGDADARAALAQQVPVCAAVEAGGEYDPAEPRALRAAHLERAVSRFRAVFGRAPNSICPPDYRFDAGLESDAERLGVTILQGRAEQHGHPFARLRRWWVRGKWPRRHGVRFDMPSRIAFEPVGPDAPAADVVVRGTLARVRAAWSRRQPAVISSHRVNYAHLDPAWSTAGRAALRALLASLAAEGATFLVDHEVRMIEDLGWSLRPLGAHGALLRVAGASGPLRFAAPAGVLGVAVHAELQAPAGVALEGREIVASLGPGTWRLEWRRA